ncbi:MAG: hypothetical protein IBX68_01685 [Dehalococcoidia bacterium]|nr:hypothetical protein [Dehalococcoidia bacterium]
MAHHRVKGDRLAKAGLLQILLHSIYARNEAFVLRIFDRTIKIGFLNGRGKPILKLLARVLGFLPTAEIVSLDRALDFVNTIDRMGKAEFAVGPCVCQKALNQRKGIYMKDLVVLYGAESYKRASAEYRDIDIAEVRQLLKDLQDEGMMQAFYACMRSKGWVFVICGCECEICLPFRAHRAAGGVMSPGPDIVSFDREKCAACGTCVDRCHFGANWLNGSLVVELDKCYGCGLCVATCSSGARTMIQREGYKSRYYPLELIEKERATVITEPAGEVVTRP